MEYRIIEYGKKFVGFGKGLYGWQVYGLYDYGTVLLDDNIIMDDVKLKKEAKRLFDFVGRINNIKLARNKDNSLIVFEYNRGDEVIPIGYLNLVDDSNSEEEELTVANW